jgi:hypothetical protein
VVDHGEKLKAILAQLNPGKALEDISQLDEKRFAKALPQLQEITERPFPVPPPSPPTIREVARKLLSIDERSPGYWPTVLRFIQFASAGLSPDVPAHGPPTSSFTNNVGFGLAGMINISHEVVLLGGGDLSATHFDHSRIIFTEHPVHMRNVTFTDCVFEMPISAAPNQYLKNASRALLTADLNSVQIPSL